MIARRDLLIAAACLTAAGSAAALKPRREVRLLQNAKMADVVPAGFGDWMSQDMGDPYAVNGPGTLSSKLYNQLLVRSYRNGKTGVEILALLAYGGRQSDDLQLHRPEVCYPAFGYNLVRNEPLALPIGRAVTLPARQLAAEAEGRRESIIYWSRLGELLPQDGGEQRSARLRTAMQGVIPDGLLSRFSMPGDYPERDWKSLAAFVAEMIAAIAPGQRKVLVGTERADRVRGVAPPAKA